MSNGNQPKQVVPSGVVAKVVAMIPKIRVIKLWFFGGIKCYYCRYPVGNSAPIIHPPLPSGARNNFTTKELPDPLSADDAHYLVDSVSGTAKQNYPGIFVREGATGTVPPRNIFGEFHTDPSFNGTLEISATGQWGMRIDPVSITFKNGISQAQPSPFVLVNCPSTVKWLSNTPFDWYAKAPGMTQPIAFERTIHTFFIVDGKPLPVDVRTGVRQIVRIEAPLFEFYDWSCRWADGAKGPDEVLQKIWAQFDPVRRNGHDTALVYWKNHLLFAPNQDIISALQSHDDPDVRKQNSASCIVWATILLNCLSVHGIKAAEIMLTVDRTLFKRGSDEYQADGWDDTTTIAQGTTTGPPHWNNHWITNVNNPAGKWRLFDPSYGAGPVDSTEPKKDNDMVDVEPFAPLTVKNYTGVIRDSSLNLSNGSFPRIPGQPPKLLGTTLFVR